MAHHPARIAPHGRPDLGLELGCRESFSRSGVPGLAMRAARTYIEAAEIAIRYQKQISGVCRCWHEHDDEHLTVVLDVAFDAAPDAASQPVARRHRVRQLIDFALICRLLR
jgi:hypothetical protein